MAGSGGLDGRGRLVVAMVVVLVVCCAMADAGGLAPTGPSENGWVGVMILVGRTRGKRSCLTALAVWVEKVGPLL